MKLKQGLLVAGILSVFAFTGCHSKHKDDMTVADANRAYSGDEEAQSIGLGDENGFGENGSRKNLASNRIYYFDFDSNVIHESDRPAIIANAEKISANASTKAIVEGHTDPRGSREYNIGLGERRAKAVAQLLKDNGVKHHQIRIVSYGAQKPASNGNTEADYQLDRRSVLDYLPS